MNRFVLFVLGAMLMLVGLVQGEEGAETTGNEPVIVGENTWSPPLDMTESFETDYGAFVRSLAAKGEICKVFGHMWRDGRPGESETNLFADYRPNTQYRTCKICGKCESLSFVWQ